MNAALIVALWAVTLYVLVRDARPRPLPAPAPEPKQRERWTIGYRDGGCAGSVEAEDRDTLLAGVLLLLEVQGRLLLDHEREVR